MNDPSADKCDVEGVDWILELYIASGSPASRTAQTNLIKFCEAYLPPRHYKIEVHDVTGNQELARLNGICAVPALLRTAACLLLNPYCQDRLSCVQIPQSPGFTRRTQPTGTPSTQTCSQARLFIVA
jgi:hypothetical protein